MKRRRQAFIVNVGQVVRVRLAILWGVDPEDISDRAVNRGYRQHPEVWLPRQKVAEEVVAWT